MPRIITDWWILASHLTWYIALIKSLNADHRIQKRFRIGERLVTNLQYTYADDIVLVFSTEKILPENVAINDVLPRRAAKRDAIANRKFLAPRYNSDLISMVPFTFATRSSANRTQPLANDRK